MIRPDTNVFKSSRNSTPFEIKTQWNGITYMQLTSLKVPSSTTIPDQLRPLPRSSSRASIYALTSKCAPITVMWVNFICLYRSLDEKSRKNRKTKVDEVSSCFVDILKVKVGKGPHNPNRRLLAGKYAREEDLGMGRSWSCIGLERGTFGEVRCMHVILLLCVFILDGALFGNNVKNSCPVLLKWVYER